MYNTFAKKLRIGFFDIFMFGGFMRKSLLVLAVAACAVVSHAYVVVDKIPNSGTWVPLGPSGTPIYTNSFIFTGATGDVATKLGGYVASGDSSPTFQFLLLADNANTPSSTILASSAYTSTTNTSLTLLTENVTSTPLVNGQRYWVALSSVGGTGTGWYSVGAHQQNSIYADNGTFWFSNAGDLNNYDGQAVTPEISIYVEAAPVPEPATMAALGFGALALLRRRRK